MSGVDNLFSQYPLEGGLNFPALDMNSVVHAIPIHRANLSLQELKRDTIAVAIGCRAPEFVRESLKSGMQVQTAPAAAIEDSSLQRYVI